MYVVAAVLLGGSTPGLSIVLESMSYTDMKEGIRFSCNRGPAAEGMSFPPRGARPCGDRVSVKLLSPLCLDFLASNSPVLESVPRSGDGGVEMVTAVNDLFRHRPLAFWRFDGGAITIICRCITTM